MTATQYKTIKDNYLYETPDSLSRLTLFSVSPSVCKTIQNNLKNGKLTPAMEALEFELKYPGVPMPEELKKRTISNKVKQSVNGSNTIESTSNTRWSGLDEYKLLIYHQIKTNLELATMFNRSEDGAATKLYKLLVNYKDPDKQNKPGEYDKFLRKLGKDASFVPTFIPGNVSRKTDKELTIEQMDFISNNLHLNPSQIQKEFDNNVGINKISNYYRKMLKKSELKDNGLELIFPDVAENRPVKKIVDVKKPQITTDAIAKAYRDYLDAKQRFLNLCELINEK